MSSPSLKVRFLVACPRSGSTLLMRVFAENDVCAVTSRSVFMGNWGKPDYSIFKNPLHHQVFLKASAAGKAFLINKDELGHDMSKNECNLDLLPDTQSYAIVKPTFLVRDPIRVFDSWKRPGWVDIESLAMCSAQLDRMLNMARKDSFCLIYEQLVQDPSTQIRALCSWWDVPFEHKMLHFSKPFGNL